MKYIFYILLCFIGLTVTAQDKKIVASAWDGVLVSGYADQGAFVNFGGPSIKYIQKPFSIGLGVLPSMRIKQDQSGTATRNSWVMPSLGGGITFTYKHLAVQIPFFYNNKVTAGANTADGSWNSGLGIGYKF